MRGWAVAIGAFWMCLASPAQAADSNTGDPATQSIMHAIFSPISQVLPLSFDDAVFRSPERRQEITGLLLQLRDNAGALHRHAIGKERAFEFVAKSLQTDAKQLYRWYTEGRYDEAQFTLHNMTENCITCHSTLPETHKFPPASSFFAAVKADSLHPLERAHYYVMSRQFDDALSTYEAYFKQGDVAPSRLVALGSFVDYLKVCVSVKQDLARPRALIDSLMVRPEMNAQARLQLKRWSQALAELDASGALRKVSLADARAILKNGREHMEFPRDRDGVVDYLVASSILDRYVHSHPDYGRDVGEAYYMLGITESLLGHSFWVSRSEFYLESAIRLAPGAAFAPKAFDLLEESYTVNYSGSGGTDMPDDVKALLAELRKLVDTAHGGKA